VAVSAAFRAATAVAQTSGPAGSDRLTIMGFDRLIALNGAFTARADGISATAGMSIATTPVARLPTMEARCDDQVRDARPVMRHEPSTACPAVRRALNEPTRA
jgi:hypothetical protein